MQTIQVAIAVILLSGFILFAQQTDNGTVPDDQNIIRQFESKYGFVPDPVRLFFERPDALKDFMQYGNALMQGGPLTERELNLVTLAAAAALHSPGCVRNQIRKLKKLGISNDEIVQTILVAGMLGNTTVLQDAWPSLQEESVVKTE